jgi:GNAT superfamily N-acetyltransferase
MDYRLHHEDDAAAVQAAVLQGLRQASPADVGARDYRTLALSLRDAEEVIVGGVFGATMWDWLMIDGLWVDAPLRARGLGRQLLLSCEAMAVERGCRGAWLGTFDFQARGFYERLGYTVFAALPEFPRGHTHFHLWKPLSAELVAAPGA